ADGAAPLRAGPDLAAREHPRRTRSQGAGFRRGPAARPVSVLRPARARRGEDGPGNRLDHVGTGAAGDPLRAKAAGPGRQPLHRFSGGPHDRVRLRSSPIYTLMRMASLCPFAKTCSTPSPEKIRPAPISVTIR